MEIVIDEGVKTVLEFMQANIGGVRLANVSEAIGKIGPILWSHMKDPEDGRPPIALRGSPLKITQAD